MPKQMSSEKWSGWDIPDTSPKKMKKMAWMESCMEECMDDAVKEPDCQCMEAMPECMLLAHAYVPWQTYCQAFSPREALMKGTLFPELWGVYPIPE